MTLDLDSFSDAELMDLNRRIVDLLRDRRQAKTYRELAKFSVGDVVRFTANDGREIKGEVLRVSKKTVTVCSGDGHHWRVSPTFLTKLGGQLAPWEPRPAGKHCQHGSDSAALPEPSFESCRETVSAWWGAFADTPTHKGFPEDIKRSGLLIVTAFADFMFSHHGQAPSEWTDRFLRDVVVEIMPRKIIADPLLFTFIVPVLTNFFRFLAATKRQKNAGALARRIGELSDEIMAAVMRGSPSLPRAVPGGNATRPPLMHDAAPGSAKVGRNDKCPCGSGSKFKKCCAGKLSLVGASH